MKLIQAHISLEGSAASMHLAFPKLLLPLLVALKRIVQFLLLILVINVFVYWTHQYFTDSAQEQKNRLFSRFQALSSEIDEINTEMASLYSNEDLLYAKFGLMVPDTGMKEMGFGGNKFPDSMLVLSASSLKRLKLSVSDKFNNTEAKVERAHSSYLNLQFYIEQLHGNLQHTPSVSPAKGIFISPFGPRTHPVTGELGKMHMGVDISSPRWTPIRATANGKVSRVADSETLGRHVIIDHGNGIETRYGHMVKPFAKEGQIVKRFDVIGYMGSTGRATGNHVHYEVWQNGEAVNPAYYMLPDHYSVE